MHLLTINCKADLERVRTYMEGKWRNYAFTIQESDLGYTLRGEHKETKKRLTVTESNIMLNLLPYTAQAFYAGMCEGAKNPHE